jgi:dihydroneopterin aldolase
MKNTIHITGVDIYAHHGCSEAERNMGGKYSVDVELYTDFSKAGTSDKLNDTIDYVAVRSVIQEEMAISSSLIEHVAYRILNRLKKTFTGLQSAKVVVRKLGSPIGGFVREVAVTVEG